jgi:hypothetical protein
MSMSGGLMASESMGLGANPDHLDALRTPAETDPRTVDPQHEVEEQEPSEDELEAAEDPQGADS